MILLYRQKNLNLDQLLGRHRFFDRPDICGIWQSKTIRWPRLTELANTAKRAIGFDPDHDGRGCTELAQCDYGDEATEVAGVMTYCE